MKAVPAYKGYRAAGTALPFPLSDFSSRSVSHPGKREASDGQ
jgi:hypothetical protein